MGKIQIVFNEWGAGVRVVANTVSSDPGVQQWKRHQKEKEQDPFESAFLHWTLNIH